MQKPDDLQVAAFGNECNLPLILMVEGELPDMELWVPEPQENWTRDAWF